MKHHALLIFFSLRADLRARKRFFTRQPRGAVLAMVLVIGICLVILAGGLVGLATHQTQGRARYETYKDEFAAAEEALNKAFSQVQYLVNFGTPDFFGQMQALTPPTVEGYTFPLFQASKLSDGSENVTTGPWTGLTLHRIRYQIDVTAHKTGGSSDRFRHPGVSIRQNLEITYIPLFMFAIFYDPVMEIAPGPYMKINGLVHANGDAYIQSQSGLDFLKNVTVAGEIYHGRNPASGKTTDQGEVQFTNNSQLRSMKRADSDGWLTSVDSDWATAATDTWGGGLKNRAQGVRPLSLPIPTTVDPYAVIDRADPTNDGYAVRQEKFENKAGLKIITATNGTISGYDQAGMAVALTYIDPKDPKKTKSIVSTTTFYDAREGKTVTSTNIDMANMIESGIMPANGILYVSNEKQGANVVRLKNGATLPVPSTASGLTVATDEPLYIAGNYNNVNKTMAMVVADALTILSNAWDDANGNTYSKRIASATEVNAVCMQGIVPSANSNYSGGVENYFRFLEQWSGKEFKFSGSIINMWKSRKALGVWKYDSPVYTAPNRTWSWDTSLGGINGPPGASRVVELTRTAWELKSGN